MQNLRGQWKPAWEALQPGSFREEAIQSPRYWSAQQQITLRAGRGGPRALRRNRSLLGPQSASKDHEQSRVVTEITVPQPVEGTGTLPLQHLSQLGAGAGISSQFSLAQTGRPLPCPAPHSHRCRVTRKAQPAPLRSNDIWHVHGMSAGKSLGFASVTPRGAVYRVASSLEVWLLSASTFSVCLGLSRHIIPG